MKIFFSLNHFLPDSVAGIEVYTFNLAIGLQQSGAEVAILIPGFDTTENETYLYKNIRVIKYAESSVSNRKMILGKRVPEGLSAYQKILERERPSILHFQEIAAGRGISMHHVEAVAAMGIKILLTCHLSTYTCQTGNLVFKDEQLCDGIIHRQKCTECAFHARGIDGLKSAALLASAKLLYGCGIDTGNLNSSLGTALGFPFVIDNKKRILHRLSLLCDKIIVLTRWYQQIMEANGVDAKKLHYCQQGLTGSPHLSQKRESALPLKIVFIGRVSKYKGVHLLLKAVQQLPEESLQLDIYGPVTEDQYAKECVEVTKGNRNIHWKGSIASENVINMLGDYDLLCLPSTFSEMSPLVIQEAFAAGVPVLASNVYGNSEQVTHGVNGWLFAFKNINDLKKQLQNLIEDPSLIDTAKRQLPPTTGFNKIAKEHLDLYYQLMPAYA